MTVREKWGCAAQIAIAVVTLVLIFALLQQMSERRCHEDSRFWCGFSIGMGGRPYQR